MRYPLVVGTRGAQEVEVVDVAKPREVDDIALEAWERMRTAGCQVDLGGTSNLRYSVGKLRCNALHTWWKPDWQQEWVGRIWFDPGVA